MRRLPSASSRAAALLRVGTLGLLLVAVAPALAWLVQSWRVNPYYSHGPLALLVAAWLLARQRSRWPTNQHDARGLWLVAFGVLLLVIGAWHSAPPLTLLGLLVLLLGYVLVEHGPTALRTALGPGVVVALAVPLPWVERLAPALAGAVATSVADILAHLGIEVVQTGALLATQDGQFSIGGPCSGLRSAMAMLTLGVVAAVLMPGSWWRQSAVILLAVPLALLVNWLRLVGLFLTAHLFGNDLALSVYHPLSSPLWFLAAAAALHWFASRGRPRLTDVSPSAG